MPGFSALGPAGTMYVRLVAQPGALGAELLHGTPGTHAAVPGLDGRGRGVVLVARLLLLLVLLGRLPLARLRAPYARLDRGRGRVLLPARIVKDLRLDA